jgi:glutathione peroxidase
MTAKQIISKGIYPILMFLGRLTNKKASILFNKENKKPLQSFYTLQFVLNDGTSFLFEQLRGKKVMIVNTASNCGYTNQYDDLQKLYELNAEKFIILGFPSNDFNEQEKGNDEEIAAFCKVNFGVTFPLMKKSVVVKSADQNGIYKWLTDANKNGWNKQQPAWNFSKYIINEEGTLTHYFETAISPLSEEIQKIVAT